MLITYNHPLNTSLHLFFLHITKSANIFPHAGPRFYKIQRLSSLITTAQTVEDQRVFQVPQEKKITKAKRYGRRKPIQDANVLEKAIQTAVLRSTDGKYKGSENLLLSKDPAFKLRKTPSDPLDCTNAL
ncbi:hypothetical protein PORY_000270 [Pneumocystis oryctolagi]|uniref:Uncharacterized protein n=1 Tax=Pneumocystis oryctolagi TaxID=42067 RepID=A0ACB7CHG4_9ASCO|nr:hypothetical protein PORY_000270 [Pneumocystis oryctolagi]